MILDANQLEPSWSESQRVGNAREVSVGKTSAWVVEFHNPKITELDKQNLNIVIANDGYFIGSTFDRSKFSEKNPYLQFIGIMIIAMVSLIVWFAFLRKPKGPAVT